MLKTHTLWTTIHKSRFPIVGIAVVVTMGVVAATVIASPSTKTHPRRLAYTAWVASSLESHGCLGPRGVYSQLSASVKPRVKLTELKKLAKASKPRNVKLKAASRSYDLAIDPISPGYGNGQVIWAFRRLSVDARAAKKLVGKTATISYQLGSKSFKARTVKVENGSCDSPI